MSASGPAAAARQSDDWIVPAILLGLAAVLWIMSAVFGVVGWNLGESTRTLQSWPTTEAVVVVNEQRPDVRSRDPKTGHWHDLAVFDFEYAYEVDGRSFTGSSVNLRGASGRLLVSDHPVGSRLRVYYDPADPATAGVWTEASFVEDYRFYYACGGITTLGLLLAGLALWAWLRIRRARTSPLTASRPAPARPGGEA